MTYKKIIILSVLSVLLTCTNGKVVLTADNIKEILNSIEKTKLKNVSNDFDATVKANISIAVKSIEDATNNSIENEVENRATILACNNVTVKYATDTAKKCVNETENLTALILTDFIEKGQIKEARNASYVNPKLFLGVESYSGYFTVNKTYNSNIFFWYFPVENKPVNETPWLIWLQGGPGASSLTGLFEEIGPLKFNKANNKLIRNEYTWLQNHSLLFFDNPVGTGFSFTDDVKGYVKDMATYSKHLYSAFQQFVQVFPELRTAPLYVAGESYAGKYVPALGVEIHKRMNKPGGDVNLQGFLIGNAYVDPTAIMHQTRPFLYFGLIEQEQVDALKPLTDSLRREIEAHNSTFAKALWTQLLTHLLIITYQSQAYNFLRNEYKVDKFLPFLNRPDVQKALHVRNTKYDYVNMTVNVRLAPDFLSSSNGLFETLLEHYRVLAYCGHLDLMMPCVTTSENYRTWKWDKSAEFIKAIRFPYLYKNKRAGYYKTGGGLTEVVFLGAGHMVPVDTPGPAKDLVTRWTHKQKLSRRFSHIESIVFNGFVKNNSMLPYL